MRPLLHLAQACMSAVKGDSFLCRVRQMEIDVRATVRSSGGYSGEPISNCSLTTTLRGHAALSYPTAYVTKFDWTWIHFNKLNFTSTHVTMYQVQYSELYLMYLMYSLIIGSLSFAKSLQRCHKYILSFAFMDVYFFCHRLMHLTLNILLVLMWNRIVLQFLSSW